MKTTLSSFLTLLKSDSGRLLSSGARAGMLVNLSSVASGFLLFLILARLLGAQQFGIYVLVVSWMQLLFLAGRLGMDTTVLRYSARYRADSNWPAIKGLLDRSQLIVFTATALIGVSAVLVVLGLSEVLGRDVRSAFLLGCALLPVWGMISIRQSALQAANRIARSQLPESVLRPLFFISLVFAWHYFMPFSMNASVVIGLGILASLAALLLVSMWFAKEHFPLADVIEVETHTKEWLRFGLPVAATAGLTMLIKYTDVLMLGAFRGAEESGIYSAASQLSELTIFGLTAVNLALAPMISQLHVSGDREELQRAVTLSTGGGFVFALIAALVLLGGGEMFLSMFGAEFTRGFWALSLLVVGQLFSVGAGSVGYLMTMTGHQVEALRVLMITALLNFALNAAFIPSFGMLGAGAATAISIGFWNISLRGRVQQRLQIDSSILSIPKLAHSSAVSSGSEGHSNE